MVLMMETQRVIIRKMMMKINMIMKGELKMERKRSKKRLLK